MYRIVRNAVWYWVKIVEVHPENDQLVLVRSVSGLFFEGWVDRGDLVAA